jgi:hypothetical protein
VAHKARGWSEKRSVKRRGACGPSPCALPKPAGRRPSPSSPGTHDGVCEPGCWADKYASRLQFRLGISLERRRLYSGAGRGRQLGGVNSGASTRGRQRRAGRGGT